MKQSHFTQEQLRAIADALGDTDEGLTGSEIAHLLASAEMTDTDPTLTKRHRLYNAFVNDQKPASEPDPHHRVHPQGDEACELRS